MDEYTGDFWTCDSCGEPHRNGYGMVRCLECLGGDSCVECSADADTCQPCADRMAAQGACLMLARVLLIAAESGWGCISGVLHDAAKRSRQHFESQLGNVRHWGPSALIGDCPDCQSTLWYQIPLVAGVSR